MSYRGTPLHMTRHSIHCWSNSTDSPLGSLPQGPENCLPHLEHYTGDSGTCPSFSLPVLPHFRAAAFFVPLGPLVDRVHHNADVWEGSCLGYCGVVATVRCLPQCVGVLGGSSEGI